MRPTSPREIGVGTSQARPHRTFQKTVVARFEKNGLYQGMPFRRATPASALGVTASGGIAEAIP